MILREKDDELIIFFESSKDYINNYRIAETKYNDFIIKNTPDYKYFHQKELRIILGADYSKLGDSKIIDLVDFKASIYEFRFAPVITYHDLFSKKTIEMKKKDFLQGINNHY